MMSQADRPTITVVVVTWNSAAVLPDLLESLDEGLRGLSWHLVVADNNSADGSVDAARRAVPDCRIVQTGRNAGYAAAFNAGLAGASGHDAVLLLNPDVRLAPGCGATLFGWLGRPNPGGRTDVVGIAVPRIRDVGGRLYYSLKREPAVRRALGEAVLGRRAGRVAALGETVLDDDVYGRTTSVDWATGAALMMSGACLAASGRWDESFFLYSEETEFCLRARDHGYATVYVPEAEVVHIGGGSDTSPALWSLLTLNRVRLYRRRHGPVAASAFWAAVVLREVARTALGHRRSRRALLGLLWPSTVPTAERSPTASKAVADTSGA
jgi:N-acetylglucosaminyl-diphospho-decaprenol L-rhamnosyltransferase